MILHFHVIMPLHIYKLIVAKTHAYLTKKEPGKVTKMVCWQARELYLFKGHEEGFIYENVQVSTVPG